MADADPTLDANEPAWRRRAVSRSLDAARSRAEKRAKRFLDAAFELMDEKGTTEFTIQEVIDRSQQSLRGFYQYFDGKDELLLALFEETVRESMEDLRAVVEAQNEPLDRLRALHVNDATDPLGSNRDRHANIGQGKMKGKLGVFLSHPRLQGLPAFLETPGQDNHGPDANELRKVRRLHKRWLTTAG